MDPLGHSDRRFIGPGGTRTHDFLDDVSHGVQLEVTRRKCIENGRSVVLGQAVRADSSLAVDGISLYGRKR